MFDSRTSRTTRFNESLISQKLHITKEFVIIRTQIALIQTDMEKDMDISSQVTFLTILCLLPRQSNLRNRNQPWFVSCLSYKGVATQLNSPESKLDKHMKKISITRKINHTWHEWTTTVCKDDIFEVPHFCCCCTLL